MNLEIIRGLDINTQQAYVKRCIVDDVEAVLPFASKDEEIFSIQLQLI